MNKATILVIDDEIQIQKLLQIVLETADYKVVSATTMKDGIATAAIHPPDLILLDIGLPDDSGQNGLLKLREWYTGPIIMLTVLNDEEQLVQAFDNGATDYLTKPFRTGELLARLRSILKSKTKDVASTIIQSGDLEIDIVGRTVKKDHQIVKLTATEYNLLSMLAKNEGRVLTHNYLLKEIWGPSYQNESQYLRVFIGQLRKKIENDPTHPVHLITEASVGYRFM